MQYKHKDIDGKGFIEGVPEREFEAISGEFSMALDKSRTFGDRLTAFIRGENRAGRIAGSVLDIGTVFLPFGRKVQTGREAAKVILNRKKEPPMKKAIKRALTGDGGSWITVRDEDGDLDVTAIGATLVRLGIIVGVLYAGKALGILDQLMKVLQF